MIKNIVKIKELNDNTPEYHGYSNIVQFGDRYFRTEDAEQYYSALKEISKVEFERLLEYVKK